MYVSRSAKNKTNIVPGEHFNFEWYISFTDVQKRKLLPAWIREGLENMERQKQKAEEKERLKKEREEKKKQEEEEKAAREEEERKAVERGELSPSRLLKSKFVSVLLSYVTIMGLPV